MSQFLKFLDTFEITMLCATLTIAVDVVMVVPPEPPETSLTSPLLLSTITNGTIEDMGRFPGLIKFEGDAGTPK